MHVKRGYLCKHTRTYTALLYVQVFVVACRSIRAPNACNAITQRITASRRSAHHKPTLPLQNIQHPYRDSTVPDLALVTSRQHFSISFHRPASVAKLRSEASRTVFKARRTSIVSSVWCTLVLIMSHSRVISFLWRWSTASSTAFPQPRMA